MIFFDFRSFSVERQPISRGRPAITLYRKMHTGREKYVEWHTQLTANNKIGVWSLYAVLFVIYTHPSSRIFIQFDFAIVNQVKAFSMRVA